MRGTHVIDPARSKQGPAVRQILTEWMAIDWFEPFSAGADEDATRAFAEHARRARAHEPELVAEQLDIGTRRGGWAEFVELCAVVRSQPWDWKFAVLKQLSHRHSQAWGWSLSTASDIEQLGPGADPNALCFRFGKAVIWNELGPRLSLKDLLAPGEADDAQWYLGYATMDLIECIEWQLAESSDDCGGNPFLPLLWCYASGFYPFSLGPEKVVLFGFGNGP